VMVNAPLYSLDAAFGFLEVSPQDALAHTSPYPGITPFGQEADAQEPIASGQGRQQK
jgi:hypothetical protein